MRALYKRTGGEGNEKQLTRLYLDHAATAPILPAARAAMLQGLDEWANPSSPHGAGRRARAALEDARGRIARVLEWPHDVILTSGATEAIALALSGAQAVVRFMTGVEHDAVLRHGAGGYVLPVDSDGVLLPDVLAGRLGALQPERPLVAVQHVNNETGVVQQLDALRPVLERHGAILFVDASQSAGKVALPSADLIAVSAHKLGGPPGVGALLVRDLRLLNASGGQERGYRGGTENVPAVLGFAAALEAGRGWIERARDLRAHLDGAIEGSGGTIVGKSAERLPTIGAYRMPGVPAAAQLIQFDLAGIAVSAGSACSSGTLRTSHVLHAMGWDAQEAGEVVRVSLGPETRREDVYRFLDTWQRIAGR